MTVAQQDELSVCSRCTKGPETTMVTAVGKGRSHVCPQTYQVGNRFWDLRCCCIQLPGQTGLADIYCSRRLCNCSNGSRLNGVNGFSFQSHGFISKEHDDRRLHLRCLWLSSPATFAPRWVWMLVGVEAGGPCVWDKPICSRM